jgi:hypothetical protein
MMAGKTANKLSWRFDSGEAIETRVQAEPSQWLWLRGAGRTSFRRLIEIYEDSCQPPAKAGDG